VGFIGENQCSIFTFSGVGACASAKSPAPKTQKTARQHSDAID